jgi:hypothetical protein
LDQGREGIKEGIKEGSAEPSAPASDASPVVISIPTNRQSEEFPVSEAEVVAFAELYPATDVRQELRNMRAWAISNPTKRKTSSGMLRFVNAWLSKAQNSGRNGWSGSAPNAVDKLVEKWRMEEANGK